MGDNLVLRPIPKSLQDENGDGDNEASQPSKSTGVIAKIGRAVRGGNKPPSLAKSLAELKRLESLRQQRVERSKAGANVYKAFLERESEAAGAYCEAKERGDWKAAEELYAAWLPLRAAVPLAQKDASIGFHAGYSNNDTALFLGEAGQDKAKDALRKACEARLAEAKEKHAVILAEEQSRMDSRFGAGEYDANEAAPVKRARSRVDHYEMLLEKINILGTGRIDALPLEQAWTNYAQQLLADE